MLKIITHNFWIKLVCLLVAISVWVYVANSESKVDNFPGSIPLEIRNKPQELVAIKNIDFVDLRIIAEHGVWKKLSADSFEAYIDLAGLDEGTHEVSVRVNSNIEDVQIVQINPAKVLIRLEPVVTKTVPVIIKAEGSASEGYTAGKGVSSPAKVDISGAKSIIEKISEAVALVNLNGEPENITDKIVSLRAYDEKNEVIKNVEFNPTQVKVGLQIIRASQTKTVGIKVKTSGNPAMGYWVNQITTEPATVVITGLAGILAQTEYIETEFVDVNDLSSNKVTTATLNLPSDIHLVSGQRNQVTVRIQISATSSQKEIEGKFNYQNLDDNLKITNVDPDSIKVVITGSIDKLKQITSNDVIINVDLSNHNAGSFSKDISSKIVTVPTDISVINLLPSAVNITLENK